MIILIKLLIIIFSSNTTLFEDIFVIVNYLKPTIIIHLLDEWGNKDIYQELSKYTNYY